MNRCVNAIDLKGKAFHCFFTGCRQVNQIAVGRADPDQKLTVQIAFRVAEDIAAFILQLLCTHRISVFYIECHGILI